MTVPSAVVTAGDRIGAAEIDRAEGALLGLAVGDALGTTLEFSRRDTRPHHTQMLGGGPFRLQPGQWTDDTAMALALAESLLACGTLEPTDLMRRFVEWWRKGTYSCTGTCFDIGITTRAALARFEKTADPFSGSAGENQAGNGSLMRLDPVALFAYPDQEHAVELARRQSRTTHAAPQALDACGYFAKLLTEAIRGAHKAVLTPRSWPGHPAVEAVAQGSWRAKPRGEISSSGYVVSTLEAALWCVGQTESFEDALILAVNLADDADTVGAVTGQLAGAI
jgi:ADP-ribosyl-[dinitrogen reductase] hydrolase